MDISFSKISGSGGLDQVCRLLCGTMTVKTSLRVAAYLQGEPKSDPSLLHERAMDPCLG